MLAVLLHLQAALCPPFVHPQVPPVPQAQQGNERLGPRLTSRQHWAAQEEVRLVPLPSALHPCPSRVLARL